MSGIVDTNTYNFLVSKYVLVPETQYQNNNFLTKTLYI